MRPQKVEDEQLISGLMSVLRSKGYEGSSLNELASGSGLQKASLYHRFPEGKKEIALAVLNYVNTWVENNLYNILIDKSLKPKKRLNLVIENINNLYNNGEKSCVLNALSMDSSVSLFALEIKKIMQLWIDGFTELGIDIGFKKKLAAENALQVLISIQGSLVISKGLGSSTPFLSALKSIEIMYQDK